MMIKIENQHQHQERSLYPTDNRKQNDDIPTVRTRLSNRAGFLQRGDNMNYQSLAEEFLSEYQKIMKKINKLNDEY